MMKYIFSFCFVMTLLHSSTLGASNDGLIMEHVVLLDDESGEQISFTTTHLRWKEETGTDLVLTLQDGAFEFVLSQDERNPNHWEGAYWYPELRAMPGVVADLSFTGGGDLVVSLTIGWMEPVQVTFVQGSESNELFPPPEVKHCRCESITGKVCMKIDCDRGRNCVSGTSKICDFFDNPEEIDQQLGFNGWDLKIDLLE